MKFDTVLFKDKSDIHEFVESFPECRTLGTYEKAEEKYPGVKVLSVKSSKVGKTTLARFPDLEWVVCRSHGHDNVNLNDCQARNVGVVTTSPTAENCAEWSAAADSEKEKRRSGVAKSWKMLSNEEKEIRKRNISRALTGKMSGANNPYATPVMVNGKYYGSMSDACKDIGVSSYVLKKHYTIIKLERKKK